MNNNPKSSIKRAQRESLLFKTISLYMLEIGLEDSRLQQLAVNRVQLSADKGICYIYFYALQGEPVYLELLPILTSYKPALRKALAKELQSRYTPELAFAYDTQLEKQVKIERLLDKVKEEEGF
ncbi:30S ribosome-binding factor RbfA [Candidatus Dependentiae bacterium]|nr:30S ribosome-binding factor RbfA [Candidatus Dependentiae bacterium]MCC7415112.1 30S ribosome-binding factor RbfA [Campylobacterota bacterium]